MASTNNGYGYRQRMWLPDGKGEDLGNSILIMMCVKQAVCLIVMLDNKRV